MKKYIKLSFIYAMAAIASGVFYREFTKLSGFVGRTALAYTHLHLFGLGTLLFLLVALFAREMKLEGLKRFRRFFLLYNIGLPFMVVMFYVRGVAQVLNVSLSAGASAAISGLAGVAHILITVALVFLFLSLQQGASAIEQKPSTPA